MYINWQQVGKISRNNLAWVKMLQKVIEGYFFDSAGILTDIQRTDGRAEDPNT